VVASASVVVVAAIVETAATGEIVVVVVVVVATLLRWQQYHRWMTEVQVDNIVDYYRVVEMMMMMDMAAMQASSLL
jgi:hypothetical protein